MKMTLFEEKKQHEFVSFDQRQEQNWTRLPD